jgi:hypothetical protein
VLCSHLSEALKRAIAQAFPWSDHGTQLNLIFHKKDHALRAVPTGSPWHDEVTFPLHRLSPLSFTFIAPLHRLSPLSFPFIVFPLRCLPFIVFPSLSSSFIVFLDNGYPNGDPNGYSNGYPNVSLSFLHNLGVSRWKLGLLARNRRVHASR